MANSKRLESPLAEKGRHVLEKEWVAKGECAMSGEFRFNSGGQIHELEMALAKSGDWDNKDVTAVVQKPELLSGFLKVVRGQAQIVPIKHVITCTCGHFLSRLGSGFGEEGHKNCGAMELEKRADDQLYINGRLVERCLFPSKHDGGAIEIEELRRAITTEMVLCGCVWGYLANHVQLIPNAWKKSETFFLWQDPCFLYAGYLSSADAWFDGWHSDFYRIDRAWKSKVLVAKIA